jgi:hypothetical protein
MIWLCGIVEIDIFCTQKCDFLCTIPALTTLVRNMCGLRYPWRNFHVSLKEKHCITVCGSYFSEKYPYEKFSQYMLWGVHRVILKLWNKSSPI